MADAQFIHWIRNEITEKEIEETLKKSRGRVYKPCWDLRYCPYGILVELFPLLLQVTRSQAIARNEHLKKCLKDGVYSEKMTPIFQDDVDTFNPLDYPETEEEIKFKNESCKHFGHICPVFFTGEYLENSEELLRQRADISALEKNEAAAKNVTLGSYQCQKCKTRLKDYEVGFERETKSGKVVLRCESCKRKRSQAKRRNHK